MNIELTKDAEALLCVLYAEYLKRLKSGKQNPKDFSGTDEAAEYTKNKFSFEETNEILNSLLDGDNHLTPHSARHTFASMCASAGIQPENLQKIIGHANFTTTADVYIHKDFAELAEEMAKIKR